MDLKGAKSTVKQHNCGPAGCQIFLYYIIMKKHVNLDMYGANVKMHSRAEMQTDVLTYLG
jgi:hypothetical protein